MLKTKTWVIIFSVVLGVSALLAAYLHLHHTEEVMAQVMQDGVCIYAVDLAKVEEPYSFVVKDAAGGENTVQVEPGRICVTAADCPDQICVHQGWISDGVEPIVCLPHHLVIRISSAGEADGLAQ